MFTKMRSVNFGLRNLMNNGLKTVVSVLILYFIYGVTYAAESSCSKDGCESQEQNLWQRRYILYNVNPGEGFNLRRDVYMRMASLVKLLRNSSPKYDWVLVLPPWGSLYHWKSQKLHGLQIRIPWKTFFDVESLSRYVPVIEFSELYKENKLEIDRIYYLQHYSDTFTSNDWSEKFDVAKCLESPVYTKSNGSYRGLFWGYKNVSAKSFNCLSIQGQVSTLHSFLKTSKSRIIFIGRAEVILHDMFGNANYWNIRKSMRYSNELIKEGNRFRENFLNSTDVGDITTLPSDWTKQKSGRRTAIGGPYIAVHLRRQDYLYARPNAVPNIPHAAYQVKKVLDKLNLKTVYVATDGTNEEFTEFKKIISGATRFTPSEEELKLYLDGGVAIIDQWICAHARHFIGSFESTFSFRIQEDREIFGFAVNSTFNSFCGNDKSKCDQPSRWLITF